MFSKGREIFKIVCNKRLDEIDELCKTIDYGDLKFIISSSGTETYLSGLKDPVAFLDSISKREVSISEARHKQEKFNRYLKKLEINLRNKKKHWLILISFLMEETMLLNF